MMFLRVGMMQLLKHWGNEMSWYWHMSSADDIYEAAQKSMCEVVQGKIGTQRMSWLDVTKGIPAGDYIPSGIVYRDWRDTEQRLRYGGWIV